VVVGGQPSCELCASSRAAGAAGGGVSWCDGGRMKDLGRGWCDFIEGHIVAASGEEKRPSRSGGDFERGHGLECVGWLWSLVGA